MSKARIHADKLKCIDKLEHHTNTIMSQLTLNLLQTPSGGQCSGWLIGFLDYSGSSGLSSSLSMRFEISRRYHLCQRKFALTRPGQEGPRPELENVVRIRNEIMKQ